MTAMSTKNYYRIIVRGKDKDEDRSAGGNNTDRSTIGREE